MESLATDMAQHSAAAHSNGPKSVHKVVKGCELLPSQVKEDPSRDDAASLSVPACGYTHYCLPVAAALGCSCLVFPPVARHERLSRSPSFQFHR